MLDDERTIINEFVEYDERGRVKRRGHPDRGDNVPVAWCSPHKCHLEDCFELHYPDAHRKRDTSAFIE
jgi:hypothetical protein